MSINFNNMDNVSFDDLEPDSEFIPLMTSEDEEAEINNNDDINENDELISDDINQLDTGNLPENNEEDDEVN